MLILVALYKNNLACALIFSIKMAECELQFESEQFLMELARHPDSVHKSQTNQYQHFVNAFVVMNDTKMKRADAVKRAQVEWKERVVDSKEHYVAALKKAAQHLKRNRTRRIDSFFKVKSL